jgi:DNA-directed RNA polymerase specialized sigma24 family protein
LVGAALSRPRLILHKHLLSASSEEEFFAEIRERIAHVIKKRIHSDDCEDVIQAAMVELRSRLVDIKVQTQVLPLVCNVVSHSIREYYQQKKREEKVLEFSADALFYYQPEANDEEWKKIAKDGISLLQKEQPRCAELMDAVLNSLNMEEVIQKMNMDRLNIYRMLFRCKNSLLKILTENLKISLP